MALAPRLRAMRLSARFALLASVCAVIVGATTSARAQNQSRLTFHLQPAKRVQLAVWVESDTGAQFRTVLLTSSVARYGIGNRPGALEMNSGFHWPYGRREGVLPVWGNRRIGVGHQTAFRRVIFRDRQAEGDASQAPGGMFPSYRDNPDPYFCLSFNQSTTDRDHLDAVACASTYNSDRGRYITDADLSHGYGEPYVTPAGTPTTYALSRTSLYPPRMDVTCVGVDCPNHPDALRYAADARAVMPELDAVSMATLPATMPTDLTFTVPLTWPAGTYHAYVEANSEGDYNAHYDPAAAGPCTTGLCRCPTGQASCSSLATPMSPSGLWDSWAETYGYAYRGQPSVVYRIDFTLPAAGMMDSYVTDAPIGHGSVDGRSGGGEFEMYPMADGTMSDDPTMHAGSGADRLHFFGPATAPHRMTLEVYSPHFCDEATGPGAISGFVVTPAADNKHSHEWGHLSFLAPARGVTAEVGALPILRYDVRVSTTPITDEASFLAGMPANEASADSIGLVVPTTAAPGETVDEDFGGLAPLTTYWVGIRGVDQCYAGPVAVASTSTTAIHFTTVSPCFVATAAYGTPLARDIGALRRFRDRHLATNAPGRALVSVYYDVGPSLAALVREHDALRAAARAVIAPLVSLARAVDGGR